MHMFLLPFLVGELGKDGYGIVALVGVLIGFSELVDLGLRAALSRTLAVHVAVKNYRRYNEVASTAMLIYLSLGVFLGGLVVVLAPQIARAFNVPAALWDQALFLLRVYGSTSMVLSFVNPVFNSTIVSNNRFDIRNGIGIVDVILTAALLFPILSVTHAGLMAYALISAGILVAMTLVRAWAAWHIWPAMRISPVYVRRDAFGELFSLGGKMFIFNLMRFISVRSDPIVISYFFSPAGVTLYTPGMSLPMMAEQVIGGFRNQLDTLATRYHSIGHKERLHALLVRGTKYTFLMGIATCVMLGVFADPIMRVWMGGKLGDDYHVAAWFMVGWSLVYLGNYAGGTQWAVLIGMNRLGFATKLSTVSGIINILASVFLAGFTPLGPLGVIVPTVVMQYIMRPIIAVHTARVAGLPVREYFRQAYAQPLWVLLVLSAVAVGLRLTVNPQTLVPLLACAAMVVLAWIPLCWWVGFDKEDKKRFGGIADGIRRKIGLSGGNGDRKPPNTPPAAVSWTGPVAEASEDSDLPR